MPERGGGFEKLINWVAGGDKKKKEEKSVDPFAGAEYTLSGTPANEAARAKDAHNRQQKEKPVFYVPTGDKRSDQGVKRPGEQTQRMETRPAQVHQENIPPKPAREQLKEELAQKKSSPRYEGDDFVVLDSNGNVLPSEVVVDDKHRLPPSDKAMVRRGANGVMNVGKDLVLRKEQGLTTTGKDLMRQNGGGVQRWEVKKPTPEREEVIEKRNVKAVLVNIEQVVDRYARTLAEKKTKEHLDQCSWYNRWFVRNAEAGYVEKYYLEIKEEIKKNRNLLSEIEIKWLNASTGKTPTIAQRDIHDEVIEKVLESFEKEVNKTSEKKGELKNDGRINQAFAELVVDFATGKIASRSDFDAAVEKNIVPLVTGAGMPGPDKQEMYASNLYKLAEQYKADVDAKVTEYTARYGPECEAHVRNYFRKAMSVDLVLGEKESDLAQTKPEGVMKWYEKTVDFMERGTFFKGTKVGRGIARIVANPVTFAAVGNLATRGALRAAGGVALGATFGGATAVLVGGALGAATYSWARKSWEAKKDIARRERSAVLEGAKEESQKLRDGRELEQFIKDLKVKTGTLDTTDKERLGEAQALLNMQDRYGVDLIKVSEAEGKKYGTKLMVETDLRLALKDLLVLRKMEFGSTDAAQAQAFNNLVGNAERKLIPEIEAANKEVVERIKKERRKAFGNAFVIALAASALTPAAYKAIKMGSNAFLGSHFDTSNTTYVEEFVHRSKKLFASSGSFGQKMHEFWGGPQSELYQGPLSDHSPAFMHGNAEVNLPPGFPNVEDVSDASGHFIAFKDAAGNLIPGAEKIPVGPDGQIAASGLSVLKGLGWDVEVKNFPTTTPGSGGGASSWLRSLRGTLRGGSVEQVHTKMFYDNDTPMHVDASTGKLTGAELNELRLYIKGDGTTVDLNAGKLLQGDSFHGSMKADINALRAAGNIKIAIAPDATHQSEAILLDIDATGHVKLPAGEKWVKDLFDPATGKFKGGIIGTVEVSGVNPDGSKNIAWLNSMKGDGSADFGGAEQGATHNYFQYNVKPGTVREFDGPWPLGYYPRATETAQRKDKAPIVENPSGSIKKEPVQKANTQTQTPVEKKKAVSASEISPEAAMAALYGEQAPEKKVTPWDQAVQEVFYGQKSGGVERVKNKETEKPLEKAMSDLKPALENGSLTKEQLDNAANKYGIERLDLITKALESLGVDYSEQEKVMLQGSTEEARGSIDAAVLRWKILEKLVQQRKEKAPEPEAPKPTEPKNERAETNLETEVGEIDIAKALNARFKKFNFSMNDEAKVAFRDMSPAMQRRTMATLRVAFARINRELGADLADKTPVFITKNGGTVVIGKDGVSEISVALTSKADTIADMAAEKYEEWYRKSKETKSSGVRRPKIIKKAQKPGADGENASYGNKDVPKAA